MGLNIVAELQKIVEDTDFKKEILVYHKWW